LIGMRSSESPLRGVGSLAVMSRDNPKGRRLPALERNILKYRAFEMVVLLFLIEDLRSYVLRTIRANNKRTIPEGSKKPYEKAWAYLVDNGVITQDESDDIHRLIDYRNTIAHDIP